MMGAVERLYRLQVDASQANRQLTQITQNTRKLSDGFGAIQRAMAAAFSVTGAVKSLAGITRAYDQLVLLEGSFEALTESAPRAADMMDRVFRTVAETGASLKDTSSTFQRLLIGFQDLGASNDQVERITQTFIKLGRVSGTSMFDTNSALIQFSQGLSAGRLQGDEMRSIIERLPLITRLIADEWSRVNGGIKVTRGEVKQLGRDGKITADIMGNALLRAADDIAEKFSKLVFTLEQELNRVETNWTLLLKTLSMDTGIGDTIKSSVRALGQAILDVNRNLLPFVNDMKTLWETSAYARAALGSLAVIIGGKLLMAVKSLTVAMFNFTRSNPWTMFALLATTAVFLIIKNWDKLKPFFLYQVPSWIYKLQGKWFEFLGKMQVGAQNFWADTKQFFADGINDLFAVINSAIIKINKAGGLFGKKFELIDPITITRASEATNSFAKQATEAFAESADAAREYDKAMAAAAVRAKKFEEDRELFINPLGAKYALGDEAHLKKITTEIEKLTEKVRGAVNPLRELDKQLGLLHSLMMMGFISESDLIKYLDSMDGTAEAAEKQAAALKKSAEEWQKYGREVKGAMDPMQDVLDQFRKIDIAVEMGVFSAEFGERYKNMILDIQQAAVSSTGKIEGALKKIKDAVDGFARDFTNTLVDSLKTGEFAFAKFAESVLETITKIVLNSMFEKFFSMIVGGIINQIDGGTSTYVPSYGGGVVTVPSSTGISTTGGTVQSVSGGTPINITVNNNAPVDVSTTESVSSNGTVSIDLIIEQKVNKAIVTGALDGSLKSVFGITRRGY